MEGPDHDTGEDRLHCHQCGHEWQSHTGGNTEGISCPLCVSDFLEILPPRNTHNDGSFPRLPPFSALQDIDVLRNHNPWEDESQHGSSGAGANTSTYQFNSLGGRGQITITTGSGPANGPPFPPNFMHHFMGFGRHAGLMGGSGSPTGFHRFDDSNFHRGSNASAGPGAMPFDMLFASPQDAQRGPRPLRSPPGGNNSDGLEPSLPNLLQYLLSSALNPANVNPADAVHTPEEFQRILEQLQQGEQGPNLQPVPPGTLERLGKKKWKQEGTDITSCTICLSDFGTEDEVTTLPCKHIFHTSPCLSTDHRTIRNQAIEDTITITGLLDPTRLAPPIQDQEATTPTVSNDKDHSTMIALLVE
ncbi:MAG: hypothetical protein Q9227_001527 [Pyrenula ochraceoflavens]